MIYRKKVPPTDDNLSETLLYNGWIKMKEPKNLFVSIILSVPIMVANAAITIFLIQPIKNWLIGLGRILGSGGLTFSIDLKSIAYIVAIFVFLVMHEMLHAVFVPSFIKSQKTFWGITPFGGFVSTTEELSKLRFVFISVSPFVALSILMPIILDYIDVFSGLCRVPCYSERVKFFR